MDNQAKEFIIPLLCFFIIVPFHKFWEGVSYIDDYKVMILASLFILSSAVLFRRLFISLSNLNRYKEPILSMQELLIFGSIILLCPVCLWVICPEFLKLLLLFCMMALILSLKRIIDGVPDYEINEIQKDTESIGAFWADQAYRSYFQNVLEDIKSRVHQFEKHHGIEMSLKSLVVIIPLSCDIRGTLDENLNINYVDNLKPKLTDQGANINRSYFNPVYKIVKSNGEVFHIAAECPNSLLTLWTLRRDFSKDWLSYQRNCFIKVFVELVKDSACTVFIYDDETKHPQPLGTFLAQKISNILKENVEVEFLEKSNGCDNF